MKRQEASRETYNEDQPREIVFVYFSKEINEALHFRRKTCTTLENSKGYMVFLSGRPIEISEGLFRCFKASKNLLQIQFLGFV